MHCTMISILLPAPFLAHHRAGVGCSLDLKSIPELELRPKNQLQWLGSYPRRAHFREHSSLCEISMGLPKRRVRCTVDPLKAPILPEGAIEADAVYMRMCVDLARKALGYTSPNPMVGCVIVKDHQVVGRGFHPKAGESHAEVFALREAEAKAKDSTAYVSLEPCNHYGRTPPCTQALIKAKVKRVVVGMVDPNPIVAGNGVAALQREGIEVIVGVEEAMCHRLNEVYIHCMLTKKPFVTLRFNMSLDGGFIGSFIKNIEAGNYYSKLLQEHDGVIVADAVSYGNPRLLSLEPGAKQPLRVVLAHSLDLPLESDIFDTHSAPTLVLADEKTLLADVQSSNRQSGQSMESLLRSKGVDVVMLKDLDLESALDVCYQRGLCSVLLDSQYPEFSGLENFLYKQAIEGGMVQKLVVAITPVMYGDKRSNLNLCLDNAKLDLERVNTRMSENEVIIEAFIPS